MQQDGSWACPKCTKVNGLQNLNCTACLGQPDADFQYEYEQTIPLPGRGVVRILPNSAEWECPKCSLVNKLTFTTCQCCRFERTNNSQPATRKGWLSKVLVKRTEPPDVSQTQQWVCSHCTLSNPSDIPRCIACGSPKEGSRLPISDADPPLRPHPTPRLLPSSSPPLLPSSSPPLLPSSSPPSRDAEPFANGDGPTLSISRHTVRMADERQRHLSDATAIYDRVRQYQRECREPFVDPDFPPADCSLYINPNKPVTHWKGKVAKWMRPSNISDPYKGQWVVFRNPSAKDIMQGALGNCWMLSALAVLAQLPHLLREIIISDQYCPEGIYQLRLCIDGEWTIVNVDDHFPCHSDGQLVFSKTYQKQLWVPLVEKALAKLYHSYEALHSGSLITGLSILTGLPCENVMLRETECSPTALSVDSELIWAKLLSFKDSSFPMAAACGKSSILPEDIQRYEAAGLELDHTYSILDVMTTLVGSRKIKLRNPWGHPLQGYRGHSPQNPRGHNMGSQWWVERGAVLDDLEPYAPTSTFEGNAGDVFTLDFSDFLRYFQAVAVCKYRPEWESTRMRGQLPNCAQPHLNLLAFEILETSEVDVSIYQPTVSDHASALSGSHKPHLVDLCVLVMNFQLNPLQVGYIPRPTSCVVASGSHIDSIVTCSCVLKPGYYVVLPLAFNHWYQPPWGDIRAGEQEGLPHTAALFTAKPVLYSSTLLTSAGFLAESLFLLAAREGVMTQPFSSVEHYIYQVALPYACYLVVAENRSSHLHFTVTCNYSESVNIVSTRSEMITTDCIPPHHRQVVAVLTQLERSNQRFFRSILQYRCSETNPLGQWGAYHTPELHPSTEELHNPRVIDA